jgi:BirA family biotin operon repressor/biotin-[acetyl-CoA-carboxylase] ligase
MKIDFINLETVSSTNTWAKENAPQFNPGHLTCITALEQTAGRGRQEKKWISPKASNLYTTVYFTVPENATYLPNLGQIMALACAKILISLHVPTQIKWPNDILVHTKKIGGVLTETIPHKKSIAVIIGLGLNVNMPETILQTIDKPATSLHLALHKNLDPSTLLHPLIKLFILHLTQLQLQGFAPFQKQFNDLLAYKGQPITVHLPTKKIEGICDTITPDGCLKLLLPSGKSLTLSTGEIL